MSKVPINIPTIRFDDNGFNLLLSVANNVMNQPKRSFDFDFSSCARIDHHAVAMLGGLARFVDYHNSKSSKRIAAFLHAEPFLSAGVMFRVDTMSEIISSNLIQNNFLSHFSQSDFDGYPAGDYIGYREHKSYLDEDKIAEHLSVQWFSNEKLKLSVKLKDAIVSRIIEIFMNAYGHGTSVQEIEQLGVFSCGQYDKKEKKLSLTVIDFGPGIIKNVKLHTGIIDDIRAMEWALTRGNSTRTDSKGTNIPRGLGFDLLSEFVKLNKGDIRIYSNSVCAKIVNGNSFCIEKSKHNFNGTIVSIRIDCDGNFYRFKSEQEKVHQYF